MKTRRLLTTAVAAFFMAAFMGSCKDENTEIIGLCPLVVETFPANQETNVLLDVMLTARFNEAMNPATVTPQVFTLTSPGSKGLMELEGMLTYNSADYTMSFVPTQKLVAGTTYTGTISSSVRDLMGNSLQEDYVWTFTTGSDISPFVTSVDPEDNATGVFLNKTIAATFISEMDPSTLTAATFTIKQGETNVAGSVSYSDKTVIFNPSSDFTGNTIYTGTISSEASNSSGNKMKNDFVWSFTTGMISAPEINSMDPSDKASGVALNSVISAVFSEAMNASTITDQSFTVMTGTSQVSGTVTYSGTTATFTPDENLLSGTTYTAEISSEVTNTAGTPLADDQKWTFNTNATLGGPMVDLKSVELFGIIAGVGVTNAAGFSEIHDLNVGIYPGVRSSITGFPPAIIVNGAMYASDDIAPAGVPAMLLKAKDDLTAAYLFAEGSTLPAPATISGDQGGITLAPGIYKSTSTLLIQSGDLTLDAQGDANAVWIFQIASDFTTIGGGTYPSSSGGNVILTGGAQAKNVFWQVGTSATIGDNTSFNGNILALTTIIMNSGSTVKGRMLARNGSVTMTGTNIINKP